MKQIVQPLHKVNLESLWPSLPDLILYAMELEQDPFYPQLTPEQRELCVEQAVQFGKQVAQQRRVQPTLQAVLNELLQEKVKVLLVDARLGTAPTPIVRAQYGRKPPTIHVYRSSIAQIKNFFQHEGLTIAEEELLCLHLCHELFHHLETKHYGYAYQHTPKARLRRWGLLNWQRPLVRTREIAAHVFTQATLRLSWSPLLLDHLLALHALGWDKSSIRSHFKEIRQALPRVPLALQEN